MKQDIENIIKKNLPEPAKGIEKVIENTEQDRIYNLLNENMVIGFNQALSQIDTSLIADEVLKVVGEKIREFKCEVPPTPNNLGKIYTEEMVNKVIKYVGRFNYNKALDDLLSNLSYNKENK